MAVRKGWSMTGPGGGLAYDFAHLIRHRASNRMWRSIGKMNQMGSSVNLLYGDPGRHEPSGKFALETERRPTLRAASCEGRSLAKRTEGQSRRLERRGRQVSLVPAPTD